MNGLELCGVSVSTLPLVEVIPAAAAAGFASLSVLDRPHRKTGLTDPELAAILADNALAVHEVEASADWLTPVELQAEAFLNPVYDTDRLLEVARGLGAAVLVAVHFGPPRPPEVAAEAFGRLCDRAAEQGMRVALEFPAMGTIADLATAWEVARLSGRENGGLLIDLWHHRRSGGEDGLLDEIPPERIFSVQLSDGLRAPQGSLIEDVQRRQMPGDGELGVVEFIRHLDALGVSCPLGIEVYDRNVLAQGTAGAVQTLHDALARVVAEARS
jgi:sugar phosphate isomerase/epimerase